MLEVGAATINWILFLGLLAAAVVDLYFRYAAFGRIESVSIDIALYTFLYSVSEAFVGEEGVREWYVKSAISGAILLLLSTIHTVYYRFVLQQQVREFLETVIDAVPDEARATVRALGKVLERAIPLTVEVSENGIRKGKRMARLDAASALRAVVTQAGAKTKDFSLPEKLEDQFLLPRQSRIFLSVVFFVGAVGALIAPVISVS